MTRIFHSVYYSVRNLALYREVRGNLATGCLPKRLREATDLNDARYVMTEVMLSGFGLTVVKGSSNQIPRGVWLTAAHRKSNSMVNENEYRAGLR